MAPGEVQEFTVFNLPEINPVRCLLLPVIEKLKRLSHIMLACHSAPPALFRKHCINMTITQGNALVRR